MNSFMLNSSCQSVKFSKKKNLNIIPVITCSTTVASFCIVKILPALRSGLWEPGSVNQLLVGNFFVCGTSCPFAYKQVNCTEP